jgi:hypothetical protein
MFPAVLLTSKSSDEDVYASRPMRRTQDAMLQIPFNDAVKRNAVPLKSEAVINHAFCVSLRTVRAYVVSSPPFLLTTTFTH